MVPTYTFFFYARQIPTSYCKIIIPFECIHFKKEYKNINAFFKTNMKDEYKLILVKV